MEDSVAARLKLFIDTNEMTSSQFADMCGIPRPSLSQLLSGRNKKVSDELVGKIHTAFPDLSVVWLLFGEGPVKVSAVSGQMSGKLNPNGSSSESFTPTDGGDGQNGHFQGCDNSSNRAADQASLQYSKENALKTPQNRLNVSNNQQFETEMKIMDLQRQIENLRQNPRRVAQITIYYDDSTFETFVPKSKG